MPFLYQVQIKDSKIQGKGLFTLEKIPKGSVYWTFQQNRSIVDKDFVPVKNLETFPNKIHSKQQMESMQDKTELKRILSGGYYFSAENAYIQLNDGGQYTNHEEQNYLQIDWNIYNHHSVEKAIAMKDYEIGDQLTQDYGGFSIYFSLNQAEWVLDLLHRYAPERGNLEQSVIEGSKAKWKMLNHDC